MSARARARVVRVRRTLIAGGALFATVFALLAAQLWLGNDPALGEGAARPAAPEQELHASVLDTVLSVASGLLEEDDGEDDERAPAMRSGTS